MDPKVYRQKLSLLAWIRVGLGGLSGLLAGMLGFLTVEPNNPNQNAYYGAYIAILVYFLSYYFAKYSLLKGMDPKNKNKLITQGIGSYIMMFLFVWILYNTFSIMFNWPHF
jgi:zinc transporter ZupT